MKRTFFFSFSLTGTFEQQHRKSLFTCYGNSCKTSLVEALRMMVLPNPTWEELYVSWLLFMAGHEKWSARSLIVQSRCWIGTAFTLYCKAIIHLLKSEDPNPYFCLLTSLHSFHQNSSTMTFLWIMVWGNWCFKEVLVSVFKEGTHFTWQE